MEKTRVTVKTPEGEIIPILTTAEVAELEAMKEDPILGLENDELKSTETETETEDCLIG